MHQKMPENTDLKVLHISENFLLVNKQCDIPVNSDTPDVHPVTVATMLNHKFPHLYDARVKFGFRFCHRLDYSTSGVLCIALNKKAAKEAYRVFFSGNVEKYYLAIVYGHIKQDYLAVDSDIGSDSRPEFSHCMCTSDKEYCVSPKTALTKILVLEKGSYDGKPATKILIKPMSGRRHQIRVHCHELGHTIVGDYTYSNRRDITPYRMFLHSLKLYVPTKIEEIDIMTEDPFIENDPINKWLSSEIINELNAEAFAKLKTGPCN